MKDLDRQTRSGRHIMQPTGYRANIPAPCKDPALAERDMAALRKASKNERRIECGFPFDNPGDVPIGQNRLYLKAYESKNAA